MSKHGLFSFELRDELASMRADRLLERVPQGPRYGPRILATERGRELEQRLARAMARHGAALDWVAERIGDRGASAWPPPSGSPRNLATTAPSSSEPTA